MEDENQGDRLKKGAGAIIRDGKPTVSEIAYYFSKSGFVRCPCFGTVMHLLREIKCVSCCLLPDCGIIHCSLCFVPTFQT